MCTPSSTRALDKSDVRVYTARANGGVHRKCLFAHEK